MPQKKIPEHRSNEEVHGKQKSEQEALKKEREDVKDERIRYVQ